MNKHKGGRPNYWYDVLRRFIPAAVNKLGKARPVDLLRLLRHDVGKEISKPTMKKYCEQLVTEGVLKREVETTNYQLYQEGKKDKPWEMVWYRLD